MDADKFDEILNSGDEAAIEAALSDMEGADTVMFGEEAEQEVEVTPEVVSEPQELPKTDVVDAQAETPESSPVGSESASNVIEQDGKFFVEVSKDNAEISSKNGKHALPYALIEGAREEAATVKAQLEEQQRINAEIQASLDETKRVSELHAEQLNEAGLDPKLLPEQMLKDPELMQQISEDYPQIGELVAALAKQVETSATPATPQATTTQIPDAFEQAFEQSAHLKNWQKSDADRWGMASQIDARLADDPKYQNNPQERLAEVERRVMTAFGDKSLEQSLHAAADVKAPIPNSPTDIGHQGSDLSANAQLLNQDAATMASKMDGMSVTQVEDLLAEASDFI